MGIRPAFNWTKVELKLVFVIWFNVFCYSFNWTKVELKREYDG